jgi:ribosomal protein S27E
MTSSMPLSGLSPPLAQLPPHLRAAAFRWEVAAVPRKEPARTLSYYAAWKCAFNVKCRRCRHGTTIYLPTLIERFGPDCLVTDLAPKFRCSECGAVMADVEPMVR